MSNVIDFKSRQVVNTSEVERRLETLMRTLDEIYSHIQDVNTGLDKMETEAHKVEEAFDSVLREFAAEVGVNNIPAEYLNYSNKAIPIVNKDGDIELQFIVDNNEEE